MRRPHLSLNAGLVWLLAFIGILPFVLLCAFAHPSADDWYMAAHTMDMGFWRANIMMYLGQSGRFFSSALLFAHPMLLSFGAFKCWCLFLVLGLGASLRWAAGGWFPEASNGWKWMLASTVFVLLLWGMSSTAQGFYWGTGSAGYTLPGLLFLCLCGMLGRGCLQTEWHPRPALLFAASLIAVAITGCSEVAMALLLAHVSMLNGLFLWRHRQVSRPLLIVLVATLAGVAMVVLTPGNAVRRTWYHNDVHHVFVPAILMALKLGVRQVTVWLAFVPFFLFSLVLMGSWPAALQLSRQRARELVVVSLLLMAATVFGGFFLGTWSMGAAIPQRAVNLVLLFFIIDWVILLAGMIALLRFHQIQIPPAGRVLAASIFLIFCASTQMSASNNVKAAWRDLLGGGAAHYDKESYRRHSLIRDSKEQDVLVPALTVRPATIFFNDLTPDPSNWRNTGCASFFRKRSVALLP